jgi:hypothetical protein
MTANRLCEKFVDFGTVESELPAVAYEAVSAARNSGEIYAATMQSLGYFGVCNACESTVNVCPGEPLTLPIRCPNNV